MIPTILNGKRGYNMTGFNFLRRVEKIQQQCHDMGLKMTSPRHGLSDRDVASLVPRDDELPIYSRDAELFTGTLEEIEVWLRGVYWARDYDGMLKACDARRRAKREDLYRQKRMLRILQHGPEDVEIP